MAEIIDFSAAYESVNGPDKEFIWRDDRGVYWYMFTASYRLGSEDWTLQFWAKDMHDAKSRLEAIKTTGIVDGQIHSRVMQ